MAGQMLSPGVQITEVDYSTYVIDSSDSIIGIVGGALKGPISPTLITTRNEALKIFGEPSAQDFGIYSLLEVLKRADRVYYRRIYKEKSYATAGDKDTDKLLFQSLDQNSNFNGALVKIEITEEGEAEDLSDRQFTLTLTLNEVVETYEECTLDTVAEKVNGQSKIATVEVNPFEDATLEDMVYQLEGGGTGVAFATTPENDYLNFSSKTYDSTMNGYKIVITPRDYLNTVTYQLYDRKENLIEEMRSLSTNKSDIRFIESYINNNSDYIVCSFDETTEEEIGGTEYTLSGGMNGLDGLSVNDVNAGLDDFSNPEAITVDIMTTPGWSDDRVINHGIEMCEGRQDCIYLIDPPIGLNAKQATDWSNCTGDYQTKSNPYNSSYAAIYWPWVQVWDTFSGQNIWLPPSGVMAAQIVHSDEIANQWSAPAGMARGLVNTIIGIEVSPSKEERDLLYGNNNVINPLMNCKGAGFVIWGQKTTLRSPSALNRINVRRLVNYLKRVITEVSNDFVFEPNDEYSWQKWVDAVQPKLNALKAQRGVYAYEIIMNETTVTNNDIDNNRMPGIIKFKPTKTAEFIPLEFQIMPTGAVINEESITGTAVQGVFDHDYANDEHYQY